MTFWLLATDWSFNWKIPISQVDERFWPVDTGRSGWPTTAFQCGWKLFARVYQLCKHLVSSVFFACGKVISNINFNHYWLISVKIFYEHKCNLQGPSHNMLQAVNVLLLGNKPYTGPLGAPLSSSVLKRRYISLQNEWMSVDQLDARSLWCSGARCLLDLANYLHVGPLLSYPGYLELISTLVGFFLTSPNSWFTAEEYL